MNEQVINEGLFLTIKKNSLVNRFELYFKHFPPVSVRNAMKAYYFRWHNQKVCWYAAIDQVSELVINALSKLNELEQHVIESAKGRALSKSRKTLVRRRSEP